VNVELEIPDYLMSGLEARLHDATGGKQAGRPKQITKIGLHADFYPGDTFEGRTFSPYRQFVYNDIVPDDKRITDIITILGNSRFEVTNRWPRPGEMINSGNPKWLLRAERSQGPETLELLVVVEGRHDVVDREVLLTDGRAKYSDRKDSGQLKVSVLGMLPRDHAELTREINALQQALRDRFRYQQTSRG
jgi:hypothetical protein